MPNWHLSQSNAPLSTEQQTISEEDTNVRITRSDYVLHASSSTCYTILVDLGVATMRLLEADEHGSFILTSFALSSRIPGERMKMRSP